MGIRIPSLLIGFVWVLGTATPSSADIITWQWTGEVDFTYGLWASAIPIGAPVSLTLSWETDTPGTPGCPAGTGYWQANRGATLTVGDWTFTSAGAGGVELNAPMGICGLAQSGLEFDLLGWSHPTGAPPLTQILVDPRMFDPFGEDLAHVLGRDPSDMRAFVQAPQFNSGFRWNGSPVEPVPEPATFTLVASLLGSAAFRRVRKRLQR